MGVQADKHKGSARRWDARLQGAGATSVEAYLNQLGEEGWQIVGIDFKDALDSPSFFQALARRER